MITRLDMSQAMDESDEFRFERMAETSGDLVR